MRHPAAEKRCDEYMTESYETSEQVLDNTECINDVVITVLRRFDVCRLYQLFLLLPMLDR